MPKFLIPKKTQFLCCAHCFKWKNLNCLPKKMFGNLTPRKPHNISFFNTRLYDNLFSHDHGT